MIPQNLFTAQKPDWKVIISESFRNLDELLEFCEIDSGLEEFSGRKAFALRVTRYFAALIEKGNPRDPLLLQVLPDARELQMVDG